MKETIERYLRYLAEEKHASLNTLAAYRRDLTQMSAHLERAGIREPERVTKTALNAYLFQLETDGRAAASIARSVSSIKMLFGYEQRCGRLKKNPAEAIKPPQIEKKRPAILTEAEVVRLLAQPAGNSPRERRDKAMLELLYATGIRVSELVHLKTADINLPVGFLTCRRKDREKSLPFGKTAKEALELYLTEARPRLLKEEADWLFPNYAGGPLSRQGFWKIIKSYGVQAGIETDITPRILCDTFAVHSLKRELDANAAKCRQEETGCGNSSKAPDESRQRQISRQK